MLVVSGIGLLPQDSPECPHHHHPRRLKAFAQVSFVVRGRSRRYSCLCDGMVAKPAQEKRRMSVVNSAFSLKRARPLGSCVPFERFKATEVACNQSWERCCKPLWLARRAFPFTPRTARSHGIPQDHGADRRRTRSAGDQSF